MEQFRQIGEVLGSLNALMVMQDDILINQRQCILLVDVFSLAFNTIGEEIRQNLKLEEKNTKWKALEQPLKELYRVFKEGELYIKYCLDNKDWLSKVVLLHHNRDCVEFHIHNLLSHFPAVIEAIETASEISGFDSLEMQRRKIVFSRKYDREWDDPKIFQWKYGKQYLIPREICSRFEQSWREDRWNVIEALRAKKSARANDLTKNDKCLVDLLLRKITGFDHFDAKLFPSSVLVGAKDYQVKRRLGGGSESKEIQWLGESFALRHFFGDIQPLSGEISTLLSLSHPNILPYFCGFYDEDRKECFLVTELMQKDLSNYAKENSGARRRFVFSIAVVVDLMLQIARGMEYLHSKQLYHGELQPSNVFLKERNQTEGYLRAKISFGLGVKTTQAKQNEPNPFIWYAPEVLAQLEESPEKIPDSKQTAKADVYSFSMICFELLTGKVPFEDSHLQGQKMATNIRTGGRPLFPFLSQKYLVSLTKRCWNADPTQRPSFSSICRILRYVKKFLNAIPDNTNQPELQNPLADCCDIEILFSKKFTGEENSEVTQIPFQMFSYRVAEKEKISSPNGEAESDNSIPALEDSTKSLSLDPCSELNKGSHRVLKKSTSTVTLKLRSPGASPIKTRVTPKASPPGTFSKQSSFSSSLRTKRDSRLPSTPSTPLRSGNRRQSGHASDSELQ